MRKLFAILLSLLPLTVSSWGIDYQNLYGCVPPKLSQIMMGGKTTIKDDEVTFTFKDPLNNIISNFEDINMEITIEINSINNQGIMLDVNHGILSHNILQDKAITSFDCSNTRLFTRKAINNWIYKWFPSKKENLNITFMFAPSYSPVFLTYKTFNYGNGVTTQNPSITPTGSTTSNIPTLPFPDDKNYKFITYKTIIFGWLLKDNKLSVISQTKLDSCLHWYSIAFTRENGMMIGADAIFGWGDELCRLNIDAYYLPPESKDIGSSIYKYKKSDNYLIDKSVSIQNNIITLKFTRLLNTGDINDIIINPQNITNIIYAIGDEMNDKIVTMHTEDDSFYVNLLSGDVDNKTKSKIEDYFIFFITYSLILLSTVFSIIIIYPKKLYKIRKFFNRLINLKSLGFYSVGNILFITLYSIWWLSLFIYSFCSTEKNEIVKRLGLWTSLNLSLSLLPISRNNISIILFKISPEKLTVVHKTISILFVFSVIIKFITTLILYKTSINFSLKYSDTNPIMGFIASLGVFLLTIFSLPKIRKDIFELFYYTHRFLSIFIIITSSIHSMITFYYILPSIILYFIDIIVRIIKIRKVSYCNFQNIYTDQMNRYTILTLITEKKILTQPACYFLICYNKISQLEWHAVSLISNENNRLTFCIKDFGKNTWSGRIYNYVEKHYNDNKINKDIIIQGPYGFLPIDYNNYKYITIVTGGIGITPIFSVLDDIYNNFQNNIKNVKFYWIIPNMKIFKMFKKRLIKYNSNNLFDISIYITNDVFCEIDDIDFKIIYTKPNISNELLINMEEPFKDNAIISCGPNSLTHEVNEFCCLNNIDIFSEYFMK
jgi:NAD(P)H-flavin reductase